MLLSISLKTHIIRGPNAYFLGSILLIMFLNKKSYFSFKANQQSQLDSRKLNDEMVREKLKHYKAKNETREKKEKNRRLEGFVITIEDMVIKQVLIFLLTLFLYSLKWTTDTHLRLYHRNLKSLGKISVKFVLSVIGFRFKIFGCVLQTFFLS